MKRWLEKLSKIERTLKNREVWRWGRRSKLKREEVTGKGDKNKMKGRNEKKLLVLAFAS